MSTFALLLITVIFCLITVIFRYWLYMLITIHDHAHLDDIYTSVVVVGNGMYLIDC